MVSGPEVEVAHDDGRPTERPLTPDKTFELLVRFDPRMTGWKPDRLRFQLAQPGRLAFAIYRVDAEGRPGEEVKTIERDYGPEMVSAGSDGKWVTESLADVATQHGPVFIGIYSPEKQGDPRLWANSNDSGEVFQREADPSLPLDALRVRRTPKLRVIVIPSP